MFSRHSLVSSNDHVSHRAMPRVFLLIALMVFPLAAAMADGPALEHKKQQATPIALGSTGINPKIGCNAGTLGSKLKDANAKVYILSNYHVMVNSMTDMPGDSIQHAAPADTDGCLSAGTVNVGNVADWVPLVDGKPSTVDAAIALTTDALTSPTAVILDVGTPLSQPVVAAKGMKVRKSGRTTGDTHGVVTGIDATVGPIDYGELTTIFFDQIEIIGAQATDKNGKPLPILPNYASFSEGGDSGSLVVTDSGNESYAANAPVGLLFAGTSSPRSKPGELGKYRFTFANPIGKVQSEFQAGHTRTGKKYTLCFGNLKAQCLAPSSPSTIASGSAVDPNIAAAINVKDRNDAFLLSLPEVVGHSVSESQSGSGEIVIKVYLREATAEALAAMPASLEGIPVETVVTGDIVPF